MLFAIIKSSEAMEGEEPKACLFPPITAKGDDFGCSDFVQLLQVIPEVSWKLVTKKLLRKSPNSFESLINSSVFFGNLLASQKSVHLFEKVFDLVAPTAWKRNGLEEFPVAEVLKCRVVCSKWNEAIDKLIPEKFLNFGKESNNNEYTPIGQVFYSIMINNWFSNSTSTDGVPPETYKNVQKFLRHFELTHPDNSIKGRNPMIWGILYVTIEIPDDDDEENGSFIRYLEDICTVLSKYGSRLHQFSIFVDGQDFFEHGASLREWFTYVPNIKELLFHNDFDLRNAEISSEDYPFPEFKHLETLEIQGFPYPVFNRLILQNRQISTLDLYWNVKYDLEKLDLPSLKKLVVDFVSPEIVDKLGSPEVHWPLEALTIMFHNWDYPDVPFVGCATLFQVIKNKFGKTLLDLYLGLYVSDDQEMDTMCEDCKNLRLDLPNLKKIEIYMPGVLICLDFLLPMRHNLEEIRVTCGYEFPEMKKPTLTSGTIVQYIGFENKILDSNIWAVFKKLQVFKVRVGWDGDKKQTNWYFREDWMRNNVYS